MGWVQRALCEDSLFRGLPLPWCGKPKENDIVDEDYKIFCVLSAFCSFYMSDTVRSCLDAAPCRSSSASPSAEFVTLCDSSSRPPSPSNSMSRSFCLTHWVYDRQTAVGTYWYALPVLGNARYGARGEMIHSSNQRGRVGTAARQLGLADEVEPRPSPLPSHTGGRS